MDLGLSIRSDHPGYGIDESVELARAAEAAGFDSIWRGETSGLNAFLLLQHLARHTSEIRLGTGIVNVYSRTPALLAMTTATLDRFSNGRTILGLGVSTETIVEQWHGLAFDHPLRRTRETIEIVDQICRTGEVDYDGRIFDVGPYNAAFEARDPPPTYVAAMGEGNLRLTGEFADGWIPSFQPFSRLEDAIATVAEGAGRADRSLADITLAPFVPTAVSADPAEAEHQVRRFLAREMVMGYDSLVTSFGFGESATTAKQHWLNGDRTAAAAAISEEMVDELGIYGTTKDVTERLHEYSDLGLDQVILVPPFAADRDDVEETIESLESSW